MSTRHRLAQLLTLGAVLAAILAAAAPAARQATVPSAPPNPRAEAGDTYATVSVDPPVSTGNSPVLSYTVTSTDGTVSVTFPCSGCEPLFYVENLTNGKTYKFTVTANNAIGSSPPSAETNAVTPVGAPDPPTIGGPQRGGHQVTVSVKPPVSDGGSPITAYTAKATPGGQTGTTSCPCGTPVAIAVTGLAS